MIISALSQFITGLIHLLIPSIEAAQPEFLLLACLCTITMLFTGEHTIAPASLALSCAASERRTALPRYITSTERTNAP